MKLSKTNVQFPAKSEMKRPVGAKRLECAGLLCPFRPGRGFLLKAMVNCLKPMRIISDLTKHRTHKG